MVITLRLAIEAKLNEYDISTFWLPAKCGDWNFDFKVRSSSLIIFGQSGQNRENKLLFLLYMPHNLSWSNIYLNLVNKSWIVLKLLGIKVMSSFSKWCPRNTSCFLKSPSNMVQTSLGVLATSILNYWLIILHYCWLVPRAFPISLAQLYMTSHWFIAQLYRTKYECRDSLYRRYVSFTYIFIFLHRNLCIYRDHFASIGSI